MFLAGVDISKTAYFIKAQSVWQMVTKLIPYDDVTRFDGTYMAGAGANIRTKVEPEPKINNFGSATYVYVNVKLP